MSAGGFIRQSTSESNTKKKAAMAQPEVQPIEELFEVHVREHGPEAIGSAFTSQTFRADWVDGVESVQIDRYYREDGGHSSMSLHGVKSATAISLGKGFQSQIAVRVGGCTVFLTDEIAAKLYGDIASALIEYHLPANVISDAIRGA